MTADAKVGLLLGLVFIVLIAFLINGLPGFLSAPSKLANVMPEDKAPNMVIDQQVKEAVRALDPQSTLRDTPTPKAERATVTLKGDKPEIQEPAPQPKVADSKLTDPKPAVPDDKPKDSKPTDTKSTDMKTIDIKPNPTPEPRTYVVQPGDNLSKIAVAMYGSELGNKLATVQALYEANKDQMKTASDILPGKKLVIPDLAPMVDTSTVPDSTPAKPAEKASDKSGVKPADKPIAKPGSKTSKPKPANPDPGSFEQAKKKPVSQKDAGKSYRVKSGENLWAIAEKQLGDGNRYREIISLNAGVLRNPNDVRGQMNLKLPKR